MGKIRDFMVEPEVGDYYVFNYATVNYIWLIRNRRQESLFTVYKGCCICPRRKSYFQEDNATSLSIIRRATKTEIKHLKLCMALNTYVPLKR